MRRATRPATKQKKPAKGAASPADLGNRLRAIVEAAILAMERRVQQINGIAPAGAVVLNDDDLARLMTLGEKAAVWMGHVRRSDEATRQAMKKLSRPAVIAWLRELAEEDRDRVYADGRSEDSEGSPFR